MLLISSAETQPELTAWATCWANRENAPGVLVGQGAKEGKEVWRGARSEDPDRFLGLFFFLFIITWEDYIRAGTEIWVPDVQPAVLLLFFAQPSCFQRLPRPHPDFHYKKTHCISYAVAVFSAINSSAEVSPASPAFFSFRAGCKYKCLSC